MKEENETTKEEQSETALPKNSRALTPSCVLTRR